MKTRDKLDWKLILAALGVVFGDIGTSPLYALRECFGPHTGLDASQANVFGLLSLVFCALIVIVSVKYVTLVLRADNRGEGGVLALTALMIPMFRVKQKWLIGLGLFGTALLVGDGMITPAISVLSAVEGLKIATPHLQPLVVPLAMLILVGLFLCQKFGTGRIGLIFGPVILLWFVTLGVLGATSVWQTPGVLWALSPHHAAVFLYSHFDIAFVALASVFLVVTGGEALYADMGHFGSRPIRWGWWGVVLPGLMLNYLGQGALLMRTPAAITNPFYLMAPDWFLLPLVGLATCATVIASQALISGVYSLARQAIQLGYFPRLTIRHTSSTEIGQIYLPQVNWALLAAVLWLVFQFKSSSALAAAYGVSVSSTMIVTTVLIAYFVRVHWRWSVLKMAAILGPLFVVELAFVVANGLKIPEGGWVPLLIGVAVWVLMITWNKGRRILLKRLRSQSLPYDELFAKIGSGAYARVRGTAIFMSGDSRFAPPALIHNLRHNKVLHERVLILTIATLESPTVKPVDRVRVEPLTENVFRIKAYYGFMETPNIREIIDRCNNLGLSLVFEELTFFLGREILVDRKSRSIPIWQELLFAFMNRNAQRATAFFKIPPDQVIEVGMQVEF